MQCTCMASVPLVCSVSACKLVQLKVHWGHLVCHHVQILPMENVNGRKLVESGQLCERKNGRGVDPNRNWDAHWGFKESDYDPAEEYPGAAPFR